MRTPTTRTSAPRTPASTTALLNKVASDNKALPKKRGRPSWNESERPSKRQDNGSGQTKAQLRRSSRAAATPMRPTGGDIFDVLGDRVSPTLHIGSAHLKARKPVTPETPNGPAFGPRANVETEEAEQQIRTRQSPRQKEKKTRNLNEKRKPQIFPKEGVTPPADERNSGSGVVYRGNKPNRMSQKKANADLPSQVQDRPEVGPSISSSKPHSGRDKQGDEDGDQEEQEDEEIEREIPENQRMKHKLTDFWGKQSFIEFERQASLYDCEEHWEAMLQAARLNRGSVISAESEEVIFFEKKIKSIRENLGEPETEPLDGEAVSKSLASLRRRLPGLRRLEQGTGNHKKNKAMIHDLYTVAIPSLVFLLKDIVKYFFRDGSLGFTSLVQVTSLMKMISEICTTAAKWSPRPSMLDGGVLKDTKNLIRANVKRLLVAYGKVLRELTERREREERRRIHAEQQQRKIEADRIEEERETQRDEERAKIRQEEAEIDSIKAVVDRQVLAKYKARQAKELAAMELDRQRREAEIGQKIAERLRSEKEQGLQERERRLRRYPSNRRRLDAYSGPLSLPSRMSRGGTQPHRASPIERPSKSRADDVFDIEDIVLDFSSGEDLTALYSSKKTGHRMSSVARGKLPERPRRKFERERTEEIPGPTLSKPEWTRDERAALLDGLERYTGSDRFETILNCYGFGRLDRRLERRDVDDLMEEARFLKQTMASQLEHGLGSEYDWLRSVPG